MAGLTSAIGTVVVFFSAYLIEKSRGLNLSRSVLYLLSISPLAVPGMVLGLAYIFAFNDPNNPLNFLYGTTMILVISLILTWRAYSGSFCSAAGQKRPCCRRRCNSALHGRMCSVVSML